MVAYTVFVPFTAKSAAEAIRRELDAGDEDFAFRMLVTAINDLRKAIASGMSDRVDAFLVEPATTGSERWDALLGGQVGRELRRAGYRLPQWAIPESLSQWWFVNRCCAVGRRLRSAAAQSPHGGALRRLRRDTARHPRRVG
ncbi:MAG: hypothetical protein NVS3B12_31140 [Acidimicrobiales bacterium]